MNIHEVFNNGGVQINNPKWNKNKKNTEPRTIIAPSSSRNEGSIYSNIVSSPYSQGHMFLTPNAYKQAKELQKYGLTLNTDDENAIESQLADAQSNWEKGWHALTRTLVSEIGLGTLRGISDLTDFVIGGAIRTINGEENDYTNPVSETIQRWQDSFNEYQAIHTTPGITIDNGGLFDAGWWFSNMPSVASSLTLLIPSTGFAKGVSYLGKATKFNKLTGNTRRFLTAIDKIDKAVEEGKEIGTLGKISQWVNNENTVRTFNEGAEMFLNGFTSRMMENYQEANQVYQDIFNEAYNGNAISGIKGIKDMTDSEYQAFIERNANVLKNVDKSNRLDVSKHIAKNAADRTFKMDLINGFFDVYELYGLRNIKRFMNAPMRASIRREHLNSIKYAKQIQAGEKLEDLLAKRTKLEKFTDYVGDLIYGSGTAFKAQLSEGVEESVNYIAQEEGLRYGHILLGNSTDMNPWDERLINYFKNPQLHDAAFWGLMGGVMFQAGGSKLIAAKHAYDVKSKEKNYKPSDDTKEAIKKTSWSEAFELPEIEGRLSDVNSRFSADNRLRTQLEQIERGINPFAPANSKNNKLNTEEEKDIARNKAHRLRAEGLLLNSMFVGNYDITKAYLESAEVSDALLQVTINDAEKVARENNTILSDEQKAKIRTNFEQQRNNIRALAERMEESYSRNLRAVGNAMRGKDSKTGADFSKTPVEYFQIIAAENMQHELEVEHYNNEIAGYKPLIDSEEQRLEKELKASGINHKEVIKAFILAQQIGQIDAELEAARRTISKGRTKDNIDPRTISGQSAIRELELRKKVLMSMIDGMHAPMALNNRVNDIIALANKFITHRAMAATEVLPEGGYRMNTNSQRYKDLDNAIVNTYNSDENSFINNRKILESYIPDARYFTSDEFKEAAHLADVFNEKLGSALGKNGAIEQLDDLSHNLLNAYSAVTYNEIVREIELSHIVKERSDIRLIAGLKHNDMNSLRGVALEQALYVLKGIAKKYYDEVGSLTDTLAYGTLNKQARERLKNILSEEDMRTYDDAMKIIALNNSSVTKFDSKIKETSAVNSILPEIIRDALYSSTMDEFEEIVDEGQRENNIISEDSISATENEKVDNTPLEPLKTDTEKTEQEKIDFLHRKDGVSLPKPTASVVVDDNDNPIKLNQYTTNHKDYTDCTLIPVKGQPDTYELDFKSELNSNAKDGSEDVFNNSNFFSVKSPIIDGGEVISNPSVVINNDGTIIDFKPGIIAKRNSVDGVEAESDNSAIPSTGGEEQAGSTLDANTPKLTDDEIASKFDTDSANKPDETVVSEDYDLDNLNTEISQRIGLAVLTAKNKGIEYDEASTYESLKEEYKDKVSEEDFDTAFTAMKGFGRKMASRHGVTVKEIDALEDFIQASAISDEALGNTDKDKARKELESTFAKILDNFAKRTVIEVYDGKKVISVENLIRYANDVAGDRMMGRILYDKFVQLLQNNDEYLLVEKGQLKRSTILNRAELSEDERLETISSVNGRTLDIQSILNSSKVTKEGKESIYHILDELEPGDELKYVVKDNGHGIEFFKDGISLGSIPVPNDTNNAYTLLNRGWIVDIPKNSKERSSLEKFFIRIMVNPNNETKIEPIINLLNELVRTSKTIINKETGKWESNPNYEKVCDALIDSIKNANIGFESHIDFSKEKDNIRPAEQLKEVYNGVKQASEQWLGKTGLTREEYNKLIIDRRIKSIQNFFDKRRDSYIASLALATNDKLSIKVDSVNEGGLIIDSPENAKPITEDNVIADRYKDKTQLVVVSNSEAGVLYSTDGTTISMPSMSAGSTFVSIPRKNGTIETIHAFPVSIGSTHLTGTMKTIQKEVITEFNRLLSEWSDNPLMTSDVIYNFINTLCSPQYNRKGERQNNPLFQGFKVTKLTGGYSGIQIEYRDEHRGRHFIKLYDKHPDGTLASVIKFGDEKATAFKEKTRRKKVLDEFDKIINENLRYNLEYDYIRGERNLKGFAKRDDFGKFIVQIPNGETHEFNSFRDFIINNGLIKVTTHVENGSNFYRPGKSKDQFDKARITFKIVDAKTPPVEEKKQAPIISTPIKKGDTIKAMIEENGNSVTIGEDIMNMVLNDTQLNVLKNSALLKEILLQNITFVNKFKDDFAAYIGSNKRIGNVSINAGTIIVTQKWIDLLNSDDVERREEAIRHLIHEGIHKKLRTLSDEQREAFLDEIRNIFNEFVAANEKDGIDENIRIFEYKFNEKAYYTKGEINYKGLEEFLVESITRPALIERLNNIVAEGEKKTNVKLGAIKSKNLFQKILSVIAKLFNLNINKGTLLEKEYKLFANLITTSKENTANITEINENNNIKEEPNVEQKEEPISTQQTLRNVSDITMDSAKNTEVDDNDVDDSAISDKQISSLGQVRDTVISENRQNFENLVKKGAIEINC